MLKKSLKKNYKKILLLTIILIGYIFIFSLQKKEEHLRISKEKLPQFSTSYVERPIAHLAGEPAKLMFPEINDPKYVEVAEANKFLRDIDDVYFVKFGENTYVYPAFILSFHHLVNDNIENQPVAISLCLLSDSALVYSRNIDNRTLTFGVLGSLFYGNLVIYDKETDSYWYQLTGESFKGKYVKNKLLALKPLEKTQWRTFKKSNFVKVLAPVKDVPFYRKFYDKYNESTIGLNTLKDKVTLDKKLPPYMSGLGINVGDTSKFYSLDFIKKQKVINDTVNGWNLLVLYDKQYDSYRIYRRFVDNKILNFVFENDSIIDKETGSVWTTDGTAARGQLKDKNLESPIYTQAYWFSWSSFFPKTEVMNIK